MRLHDGREPRIMDLCAFNLMRDDQTPPLSKRLRRFWQHGEKRFDAGGQPISGRYELPSPLASAGRVQTFQNSAMF
jgi:hypothetical protein